MDIIQGMGLQKIPLGGDGLDCDHVPIQFCHHQVIFEHEQETLGDTKT